MSTKFDRGYLLKSLLIILLLGSSFVTYPYSTYAANTQENKESINVLVVHSSPDETLNENDRMLDLLIGHFTTNITFKNSKELLKEDLEGVTHLFYYGEKREDLSKETEGILQGFSGTFIAMGYNFGQLGSSFSYIKTTIKKENINGLSLGENEKKSMEERMILGVDVIKGSKVLIKGFNDSDSFPVMVQNNNTYYFASNHFDSLFSIYLSEILHEVFQIPHENSHPGYIRLEDIHPHVDPESLQSIAEILNDKKIPYMIAVIPVYRNPETGEEEHFSDSPKLVEVLKYMQNHGGSIILHGYSHQYRKKETGEGFEFWDVDNNMPISSPAHDKTVKKTREDFGSKDGYEEYLGKIKQFETNYIETKVNKGINELVSYGLYPVAFEAPHYTMSLNGYKVVSDYFSTYVGQVQVSDKNWEIMRTSPFLTSPSFLHGMTLLPETIGYVNPNDSQAIDKMMEAAQNQQVVRDGVISGFYHPYLGVEKFEKLLNELEKTQNVSWINLKHQNTSTKSDEISIQTSSNTDIQVKLDYLEMVESSPEYYEPLIQKVINVFMWIFAILAGTMTALFIIYIVLLKNRKSGGRYDVT